MYIAGSRADGVRLFRFDGYHSHSIAIGNRESRSKRHALSDADLRANIAANSRATADPNGCSFNHCFAHYLDACSRERNPDFRPQSPLRWHVESR